MYYNFLKQKSKMVVFTYDLKPFSQHSTVSGSVFFVLALHMFCDLCLCLPVFFLMCSMYVRDGINSKDDSESENTWAGH